MEIILIILTSTLISALTLGAFYLGTKAPIKPVEDGVEITDDNKDLIENIAKWRNFGG